MLETPMNNKLMMPVLKIPKVQMKTMSEMVRALKMKEWKWKKMF